MRSRHWRVGDDARQVHADQLALHQLRLAGDPDVADLLAPVAYTSCDSTLCSGWVSSADRSTQTRSACLPTSIEPMRSPKPSACATQRGRAQRGCRIQCSGVVGHGLGQDRRGAVLAEHVQVVVAGAAIGTDRQVHACALQGAGRAETGGQLQVGPGNAPRSRRARRTGGFPHRSAGSCAPQSGGR